LVSAAAELLHRQGVQATTLTEIAEAADVPAGNVYYYFKTRDDLVRAVVDTRAREIANVLNALGKRPNPPHTPQGARPDLERPARPRG
jgi:TetR/AcrR family transcriptional repressor of nem operon